MNFEIGHDVPPCQRIGIDKIRFYNLALDGENGIDYEKLTMQKSVKFEIAKDGAYIRHLQDKTGIRRIIIKDNKKFADLIIGCKKDNRGILHEYIHLTLTVTHAKGSNLVPMSHAAYSDYLKEILQYIYDAYGIRLTADQIKVNLIEINTNILLSQDYKNYGRALKHLMSFPGASLGKLSTYEDVDKNKNKTTLNAESYKRGNDSIELIMYNKSKQMKDTGIKPEDFNEDILPESHDEDKPPQYLRIEYKLLNSKKVGAELGTTLWSELNDAIIVNWFINKTEKQIADKYQKWEEKKKKELVKLIKICRDKDPKKWHSLLMQEIRNRSELNGCPYILDIEQVYEAIRSIPNSSRYCSRSIKAIDKIDIENDIYKNHDIDKIHEIFAGLALAFNSSSNINFKDL